MKKGFTLIELLVVVLIIGILSSVALPQYTKAVHKARLSEGATVLKSILEEAEKSKRAGTLTNEEIENFYKSFAPMLSGFQKKQLRAIVEKLKSIQP